MLWRTAWGGHDEVYPGVVHRGYTRGTLPGHHPHPTSLSLPPCPYLPTSLSLPLGVHGVVYRVVCTRVVVRSLHSFCTLFLSLVQIRGVHTSGDRDTDQSVSSSHYCHTSHLQQYLTLWGRVFTRVGVHGVV